MSPTISKKKPSQKNPSPKKPSQKTHLSPFSGHLLLVAASSSRAISPCKGPSCLHKSPLGLLHSLNTTILHKGDPYHASLHFGFRSLLPPIEPTKRAFFKWSFQSSSSICRASFCNSAIHREGRASMVQGASRGIGLEFVVFWQRRGRGTRCWGIRSRRRRLRSRWNSIVIVIALDRQINIGIHSLSLSLSLSLSQVWERGTRCWGIRSRRRRLRSWWNSIVIVIALDCQIIIVQHFLSKALSYYHALPSGGVEYEARRSISCDQVEELNMKQEEVYQVIKWRS